MSDIRDVLVLDAVRTPIGKLGGGLSEVRPDDLAAHVIRALVERAKLDPALVEEVVFGAANQAGEDNRNVARMAALLADLPVTTTAMTVNRLCGSGLQAVASAARGIALGEYDLAIAGGVESMTRAPWVMEKPSTPFPKRPPNVWDTALGWRFPNPALARRHPLLSMGETAENVATAYGIDRRAQDQFALESHRRAAAAWDAGAFADEVVPVPLGSANRFERDESIRADTTLEKLASLKPAFRDGGSVTAGNSSPLNDGAAAVLLASRAFVQANGVTPLARIVATAVAGVSPSMMGIGPVPATQRVLARCGLKVEDLDAIELNEAFAAQALACVRELHLDVAKVNMQGGALALGHPIGCSGARVLTTLAHAMRRRSARRGLATLCIGVGQGIAMLLEEP